MSLPTIATNAGTAADYDEGMPGWTKKPNIAACPFGNFREWYVTGSPLDDSGAAVDSPQAPQPVGTNFQNQLYCRKWKSFINPSGFNCSLCIVQQWPAVVVVQNNVAETLALNGVPAAQTTLLSYVGSSGPNGITQAQAEQIAAALNIPMD
jgi:hypothetical protein